MGVSKHAYLQNRARQYIMYSPILYNYDVCERVGSHCIIVMHQCMPNTALLCERGDLRLARKTGGKDHEGLVEICIDEEWHKVCTDSSWGGEEANVTCRELGYSSGGESWENAVSMGIIIITRIMMTPYHNDIIFATKFHVFMIYFRDLVCF